MAGPSDFFLGRRQFLGFLAPGSLWLTSGLFLVFGYETLDWLNEKSTSRWILFFIFSYLLGYAIQSFTFYSLDNPFKKNKAQRQQPSSGRDSELRELREKIRALPVENTFLKKLITELSDDQLAQFCKTSCAKEHTYFQIRFQELEDEVNFNLGISIPLIVFSISVTARVLTTNLTHYKTNPWELLPLAGLSIAGIAIGTYMFFQFKYIRFIEEETWYRSFLMLWSSKEGSKPPRTRNPRIL